MTLQRAFFAIMSGFTATTVSLQSHSVAIIAKLSDGESIGTTVQPGTTYVRPTQKTRLNNYIFDAFGPYPIAGLAIAAGINQGTDSPLMGNYGLLGYVGGSSSLEFLSGAPHTLLSDIHLGTPLGSLDRGQAGEQ